MTQFIDAGAKMDVKDNNGNTLVMTAARVGDIRSLRRVVNAGASCAAYKDLQGKSAMDYAKAHPAA